MSERSALRPPGEDGLALIYALFAVLVLTGLATLFVVRSVSESRFTGNNRNYETAIHIAEAGADELIATHINEEDLDNPYVTENSSTSTPHQVQNFTDSDAEHDWAIAQAEADIANLTHTDEGDFYGIRPLKIGADPNNYDEDDVEQVVYGVGFVPAHDHSNRRVRVVKLKITRAFFTPDYAFLAGADLNIGGNGKILTPDCQPSSPTEDECDANVHANGNVSPTGSSWEVHGQVTATGATGSCPSTVVGGCEGGQRDEEVPDIHARDFYGRPGPYNTDPETGADAEWYDLCPDGTVRNPGATPCTGSEIWQHGTGGTTTFRGWSYSSQGGKRVWSANRIEAGIFYVYHADASINGSAGSAARAVTILVEGSDGPVTGDGGTATALSGPEAAGSLETAGNPNLVAALPDALFVVDRDIEMKGTGNGGANTCDPATQTCDQQQYSGFISAREQIDFAGNVSLNGAALMQDREDLSTNSTPAVKRQNAGVNGNLTLTYDRTLTIDLRGNVVISFWNEL